MGVIFVASNGMEIARDEEGRLSVNDQIAAWVNGESMDALFEYWQHMQDEKLGRIRDKVNPRFVWYPRPDYGVRILDEVDCRLHHAWRGWKQGGAASDFRDSAQRYFVAHSDVEPHKPWHDAKVGEYWLVTLEGADPIPTTVGNYCENLYFVVGNDYYCPTNDHRIQNAVRLTPEEINE